MGNVSLMFVSVWYDRNVVKNKLNTKINAWFRGSTWICNLEQKNPGISTSCVRGCLLT